MARFKNRRKQEKAGRVRNFFRKAVGIGLVALALAGPAKARAGEEAGTRKPVARQVTPYPNLSWAGVHGNPAIWPEYGNWGYVAFSGSPGQQKAGVLGMLNSRIVGSLHGNLKVEFNSVKDVDTLAGTGVLALSLPYTLKVGAAFGMDSNGVSNAQAGLASVFAKGRILFRNGIQYDMPGGNMRAASELRGKAGDFEITGSASASGIIKDGFKYAGQAVGAQLRYLSHLLSFGCGGQRIGEWDMFRLHYRIWVDKGTTVDLHLKGKGGALFTNPDYIGLGITKMF